MDIDRLTLWLEALERRHLADLSFQEVVRALRALSSCYVERRSRLPAGGALDSRGKRAAFALFYGPVHFHVTAEIVRALPDEERPAIASLFDLGCGTGVASAAWALHAGASRIRGWDRSTWAVAEANWTWRELTLSGRAIQGDATRTPLRTNQASGILLAYLVNELSDERRGRLLAQLLREQSRGARVLVIEPIARRMSPWWTEWENAFARRGGRADDWRFPARLPPRQRDLARAAGLDLRELTARSLWL